MEELFLDGRTALVTGGSRGVGRAVVERLARAGATVVFGFAEDRDAAEETAAEVHGRGGRAYPVRVDLSGPSSAVTELFDAAEHRAGPIDVLVNNAAVCPRIPSIVETPDEVYDRIMAVNARAVFVAIREASRRLRDHGRIVSVSSTNTVVPVPGVAAYAGSKAAVEQFTAVAAKELGPRGITVNCVSPGPTDTDMLAGLSTEHDRSTTMPGITPLGRLGRPSDVAGVVAFLAGPEGGWVNGQVVRVSGGLV